MSRARRTRAAIDAAIMVVPERDAGDKGPAFRDLPPELGVIPLGVRNGVCLFFDPIFQFRAIPARDLSRLAMQGLFGPRAHLLEQYFPRRGAKDTVLGVDYEELSRTCIAAASHRGIFNAADLLRGRGAWLSDDGELTIHFGDTIRIGGTWHQPGLIGGLVCPAERALPHPWLDAVPSGERGPGSALLAMLSTWPMRRSIDPMLLLGWIAAAYVGGALSWRTHLWLTGGFGTGKSTLLNLLEMLFAGALLKVTDATPAGLYQRLGHSSLAVVIDEAEAEQDNRRQSGLIKLARQAASGAVTLRGGADHVGSEFTTRSPFLFASILMPPLLPQDRSRLAVIELGQLGGDAPPELAPRRLRELGQQILRRMIDGWPRWRDTLAAYRAALMAAGHSARGADVFGTLLAAADLVLHDGEVNLDYAAEIAAQLEIGSLAEADDAARDEERCLQHLMSMTIPIEGAASSKKSVGEWVAFAAAEFDARAEPERSAFREEARRLLARFGLKVVDEGEARYLAVASYHAELGRLLSGTHWAGRSGAIGVWSQTLRRLPMARPSGKNLWFSGSSGKATLIPLDLVLQGKGDEATASRSTQPRLDYSDVPITEEN